MKKPTKRLAHVSETLHPLQPSELARVQGGTLGTSVINPGTTSISSGTSVISSGTSIISSGTSVISR